MAPIPAPATRPAPTWHQYDRLVNDAARTRVAAVEFAARLVDIDPGLDEHRAAVMTALTALTDALRRAQQAAEQTVTAGRGPRQ